jgi:thiamine pyrophosphate-dependent acetolactate synthase large subunit-like protein
MRVRDGIAHHLRERGVSKCFGLIGEDVAELLVSLTESGVDYFSARHESSAIAMADGYSRASGSVGVATISQGPGLLNGMNALTTAAKANSSLLVFVGQGEVSTDVGNKGRKGKFIDQELVLRGAGIATAALTSPSSAVADVVRAVEAAASGETVVLTVRPSVLNAEAGDGPATIALAPRPAAAAPDPAVISDVADLIQTTWAASKPIILAGRGAVRAAAKPELEQLAERCGALLTSTLLANGMFRGNPYDLGITGTFATPVATEMLGRADIILAFGASLNGRTTDGGELFPDALVVQFDSDPDAANRYPFVKQELFVQGDVRLSALALLDELSRREHQYEGFRTSAVAQAIASHGEEKEYSDQSNENGLDPRTVIRAIEAMLPEDRIVVTDGGHHFNWEAAYLKAYDPASWISPLDFSSIGSGTGVAVGAAIAHPDRLTVLCVGDGGLMMTIGEVSTAARYNLPVLFLVNNDAAYGSDLHILELDGIPADIALSDDVDFAAIGRAMGTKGVTVRRLADLDALKDLIDAFDGPLVVDYKVNRDVLSHSLGRFLKVSRTLTDSPNSSPGHGQL